MNPRTSQRGFSVLQLSIVIGVVLIIVVASGSVALMAYTQAREGQLINELQMLRQAARKGWQNQLTYSTVTTTTIAQFLPPESLPMTNAYGFPWTAAPFAWAGTTDAGVALSTSGIPTAACVSIIVSTAPMWRQIRVANGAATPVDALAAGAPGRNATLSTVNTACSQARNVTITWIDL